MPRPAYIIFSDSGAVDQYTNQLSFFDVVEAFDVILSSPESPQTAQVHSKKKRLTAVWMKDADESPESRFECQVVCHAPDGGEVFKSEPTILVFATWFHRIDIPAVQILGFPMLGVYVVEATLRRVGEEEWKWRQSFPFIVREATPKAPDTPTN